MFSRIERFEGFNVVAYDLSEYASILEPFCNWLVNEESFVLGDDYSTGRQNVWELDVPEVRLMAALFDAACLKYLNEDHPDFKNKDQEYDLIKDAWLTTPNTKQHIRIHTHLPPFIRAEDVGQLITVFYVKLDDSIGVDNGPFELFDGPSKEPKHIWAPRQYSLLLMTPDTWHRARPFVGERYSLATDIKVTARG